MEVSQMEKVEITAAELAEFQSLKVELKNRRVSDKAKAMGSTKLGNIRGRVALRRINLKKYAPDVDVVAYDAIHKLKNPTADPRQKITVSDNEIVAYKVLDPDFNKVITLAEVTDKVAELKGAGELTGAGDNVGDDIAETQDLIE
jgi:hypothetical protein